MLLPLLPQPDTRQYRYTTLGLIIFMVGAGLFFLTDLWIGAVAQSTLCPPPQVSCSMMQTVQYIEDLQGSGTTMDTAYITDRTKVELGSLMEILQSMPELQSHTQEVNQAMTGMTAQIVAAVAADEKVYQLLQRGFASGTDIQYVSHRIRLALMRQIREYISTIVQTESTQLEDTLARILPETATSIGLTQILESHITEYIRPGESFLIERVELGATEGTGNVFDTVQFTLTLQSTAEAMTRFFTDIHNSGLLKNAQEDNPLPLIRITGANLTAMGTTTPESTVDTPKTVYRGTVQLETYIKSITTEDTGLLEDEVNSLRAEAQKKQQETPQTGVNTDRIQQLTSLVASAEQALAAAKIENNLRSVATHLTTLKELYETLISSYPAS